MSLTFGFYNSINGDRVYDAIQMGQIFDGIITDGIYATYLKAMVVKASDNASEVIVQPGRAWFNHTWTYIDADYPVEAPTPEVILDRVDTLVLDINAEYSDRENKIIWVTGTPASVNPEAPSLINTTTHHQYPLCNVYRKAGTTMIYAADITNRVGTSDTPFVTGVLTGIDIDDLLSQWDDEFHTWENNTKTSFEAWMLNQQSVYTTWFESIRTQMSDDLTSFEEWFETIRGIIDEEAATHLQAEIDELKDMLPAGSHIDISTNESTLFNRNVTVSDGVHSKTVQFNAVGGATVESFPYIGSISVTSTDGERTAQETINIPYFGRYSVVLAFWSATVNLVGDSAVGGVPVTVKDSDDLTITTIVLDASGSGTFTATKPDTYKFIYTYGGQTMETTLQVTQETTYEVEIHGGFNYQAWLTAGRVSEAFTSLDDILEDEPTLRQLFLVHDAVDYICNTFNTGSVADVTKIFNTDLAAKWINLSDYALDHFYAVSAIKSIMDTADKYGYGEWVITDDTTTPPTWGPKGNVPVMTSNTAPYGEAVYSTGSGNTYKAFDKDSSTGWNAGGSSGNWKAAGYIGYKFLNPIEVSEVYILPSEAGSTASNGTRVKDFTIDISNDGTNWETVYSGQYPQTLASGLYVKISESLRKFALYARCNVSNNWTTGVSGGNFVTGIDILQFYGRELKVSVPTMTSNTAPFGEASAVGEFSADNAAWKAFDNDNTTFWSTGSGAYSHSNLWVRYKFTVPTVVKYAYIKFGTAISAQSYQVQGSNDGTTWTSLASGNETSEDNIQITNSTSYKYYQLFILSQTLSSNYAGGRVMSLQFYGLDYSEKEFEEGTTKKWLYDHGVELEEIIDYYSSGVSAGTIVKEDSNIIINSKAYNTWVGAGAHINLTPYNGLFGLLESVSSYSSSGSSCTIRVGHMSSNYIVTDSYSQLTAPHAPVILYLDVSSFNESKEVLADDFQCIELLKELWLE